MHLSVHTYFSLRYGALAPEQLVSRKLRKGYSHIADYRYQQLLGSLCFCSTFVKTRIQPIYGLEFRQRNQFRYTALAQNADGIREINEHLTQFSLSASELPTRVPQWKHCFVIYKKHPVQLKISMPMSI